MGMFREDYWEIYGRVSFQCFYGDNKYIFLKIEYEEVKFFRLGEKEKKNFS